MRGIHWKQWMMISLCSHAMAYHLDVKEKWPSPTPWLQDRFTDFLEHMPHHAIAVEVGVQGGAYAACIFHQTKPQQLFLIDCWEHQDPSIYDDPDANLANEEQMKLYAETIKRFENYPNVVVIKEYSSSAVNLFQDESLDWVYIDANHRYESALYWTKNKFMPCNPLILNA